MLKIERLLFPTDHSNCADSALGHALALAALYDAELHILTALDVYDDLDDLVDDDDLDGMASMLRQHDRVRVVRVAELGSSAADVILDYAAHAYIDLVVMATHGRRGVAHLLHGSVAERVVREAPCPVLTLRCDAPTLDTDDATDNRILVPFDFSDRSRYALDYAADLARVFRADLELVHVVSDAMWPDVYGYDAGTSNTEVLLTRARTALDRLVSELRASGVNAYAHVDVGFAATSLADIAAERNAELIVMASHGLTGLKRLLLGSVAENTVRLASCPVLVVKPFGKSLLHARDLTRMGMTTA
ncbi:MAG: universal stress protein [Bacteroidota bacterium]